jgi:lipopolysaccharide export LptBFGC system permease protein LptF
MLAMPLGLGFRRGIYALFTAVAFVAIVYLVFTVLLRKPLPREAILSLSGVGG